jgi:hypothetical protein
VLKTVSTTTDTLRDHLFRNLSMFSFLRGIPNGDYGGLQYSDEHVHNLYSFIKTLLCMLGQVLKA